MTDEVIIERHCMVQLITINRPQARNAITLAVSNAVAAAVDELDESDDLRVGVLTGAGGTFSAGMDLKGFLAGETPSIEAAACAASRRHRHASRSSPPSRGGHSQAGSSCCSRATSS